MGTQEEIYALLQQIADDLVTLPGKLKLSPNQIRIVTGLSDLSENLGLMMAGEFRSGNSKDPRLGFSGMRMAYPPMTYNSELWNLVGVEDDVLQFGVRASDGKAFAGGGAVVLDANGITVNSANAFQTPSSITFGTVGNIYGIHSTLDSSHNMYVEANGGLGSSVNLLAQSTENKVEIYLRAISGAITSYVKVIAGSGVIGRQGDTIQISPSIALPEITAPDTPLTGWGTVYVKSDGLLYFKNDSGSEYKLSFVGITDHGGLTGLADDDHTQYLLATGTRSAAELRLAEQTSLPAATANIDKLTNYKDIPIFTNENGRRYQAFSNDPLSPFMSLTGLKGLYHGGYSVRGANQYVASDRVSDHHLSGIGVHAGANAQYNGLMPVNYLEAGSTDGNYLYYLVAGELELRNYFYVGGWFYIPSTGAVLRPLMTLGIATIAWEFYVYNNILTAVLVNSAGTGIYSPGVALIPNAWNFCAYQIAWAAVGNYTHKVYANGVWSANSIEPTSQPRAPVGNFRVFHDGGSSAPSYRWATMILGGMQGNYWTTELDYVYESTKAFYGY